MDLYLTECLFHEGLDGEVQSEILALAVLQTGSPGSAAIPGGG